jgi:hypothetical protein
MRPTAIAVLLSVLLFCVACSRTVDTSRPPGEPEDTRETAFGHAGKIKLGAAGQEFEGQVPFYRDGDLMVYVPLSGYPGKPLSPAYVLILRLARGAAFSLGSGVGSDGSSLWMSPTQFDSKGRDFPFSYKVSGKPLVEEFSAGERTYKLEDGRVFLVDLTADPPALTQVQSDVASLLEVHPDRDTTKEELKGAVEKLSSKEKAVRDFLAQIKKK